MKIERIKGTNLELTEFLKSYVEEKISSLEKHLAQVGTPHDVDVELSKTTNHHKSGPFFRAEANVQIPGGQFYAEAEAEDMYVAIDMMKNELERQLREAGEKFRSIGRREATKAKEITHISEVLLEQEGENE